MNKIVFENLANDIVLQAVKDYRNALRTLQKHPRNTDARSMKNDCEKFFRSSWYQILTSVDGEMLMRKLNEEVC